MKDPNKQYTRREYLYSDLTNTIIKLAIRVHQALGPGFVEKIYQRAFYLELKRNKFNFGREKKIFITYNRASLGYQTVDFVVENKVIIELKAVSELNNIHQSQLLSYLKAANLRVGLLLNFAAPKLEIKQIAN